MEQSLDKKIELKDKIASFYKRNKYKIFLLITILIISLVSFAMLDIHKIKKNREIAEKYIQAGISLSSGKKETAKKFYEDIILSENKFYSVLSLNTIIEKNLISDKVKILKYFEILENMDLAEDQLDLITLKKSLYLLKSSDAEKANNILKKLQNKNSNLKLIIDEIIVK
tara:strand:+ start:1562 stop:2071 length:510 start_codon:yes stop_codon:yes gene_type:complete